VVKHGEKDALEWAPKIFLFLEIYRAARPKFLEVPADFGE
jgi:hypothetical protein